VALLATSCALATAPSRASVIIAGTRVIFPANDGEVTVRLTNQGANPALVETWIDAGDPNSTPDKVHTPFLITPPLFRMEPNRDQSLRILFTHSDTPLPTDRESVFWLNVLEVPPKPTGQQYQGKNYLQLAIRSRVKLFYRPGGLPGDAIKAPGELTFKAESANGSVSLLAHNPTPYYVTITRLTVNGSDKPREAGIGMVAPMSDLRLTMAGATQAPAAGTALSYYCINDFGAEVNFKGAVSP
jgi:P pilus assembly chaperone PapD